MDAVPSSWVQRGISLVYYGMAICVIALVIGIVAALLIAPEDIEEWEPTFSTARGAVLLGVIAVAWLGAVIAIAGKACCLVSPADLPGKGYLYSAVTCSIFAFLGGVANRTADLPPLVGPVAHTVAALGAVLFARFLEQLVGGLQSSALTRQARGLVSVCQVAFALHALKTSLIAFTTRHRGFSSVLNFGADLLELIAFVLLLRLLHGLRRYLRTSTKQTGVWSLVQ